jgi:hypothetical protein
MGMFAMKKHAFLYFVGRGVEKKDAQRAGRVWLTYSSHAFLTLPHLSRRYQGATDSDGGHSSSVANSVFTLHYVV